MLVRSLSVFALVGVAAVGCSSNDLGPEVDSPEEALTRGRDASITKQVSIKLTEVSGLTTRRVKGTTEVLAIGDNSTDLGIAPFINEDLQFKKERLPASTKQWEAVAADTSGRVFVLEESPGNVFVFQDGRLTQTIPLRFEGNRWSDENSRGEGFVLLKNGHILLLKEKAPALIVEMGPKGEKADGFKTGMAVGLDDAFPLPKDGVGFVSLKEWEISDKTGRGGKSAKDMAEDGSELAVAPDGRLYLLSDQSRTISCVERTLRVDEAKFTFETTWKLPSRIEKPEGLTFLPNGSPVVATDVPDEGETIYILSPLKR
jgi:uncharacterized protein YjiK